jgi:hypothetical protein
LEFFVSSTTIMESFSLPLKIRCRASVSLDSALLSLLGLRIVRASLLGSALVCPFLIGDPIIAIQDNHGINLIPSQSPALGSRLSASWIENSPIVLFSFHDDCGINNVDSADETPSELLGLGSRPSPSSGFEVDCRIHAVADNAILNEPRRFGSDVSNVIIRNGAVFSTSCDSFATVPKTHFRRGSQLVHCPHPAVFFFIPRSFFQPAVFFKMAMMHV